MKPRVTFHSLPGLPLMESGGFLQSQETWRPPAAGLSPRDSLMFPPARQREALFVYGRPPQMYRRVPLTARVVTGRRHFCRVCGAPDTKRHSGEPQSSINIQGWKEFIESVVKDLWLGGRSGHEVVVAG